MADYYPNTLSELDSWHDTFSAQATATGTAHNLTAGNVAQAALDNTLVGILLDYDEALRGYVQAFTEFRDICLRQVPPIGSNVGAEFIGVSRLNRPMPPSPGG